jgi:hypothetical protein
MMKKQFIIKFLGVLLVSIFILFITSCAEILHGSSAADKRQTYDPPKDVVMNMGITIDGKIVVYGPKGEPLKPITNPFPRDISRFHKQHVFEGFSYEVLEGNPVHQVSINVHGIFYCLLVYYDELGNFERWEHCR